MLYLHRILSKDPMKTCFKILFVLICSMIQGGSAGISAPAASTALVPMETTPKKTKVPVIFTHGFGGTKTRRLLYTKGYEKFLSLFYSPGAFSHTSTTYLFDREIHNVTSFNFNDVQVDMGVYGSVPNPLVSHIGQEDDIEKLYAHLAKINDQPIIGFGVSRGAATWLTTLGSKVITKNIAAVILESPFSTTKNTYVYSLIGSLLDYAQTFIPRFDRASTNDQLFQNIFQSHSLTGIQPLHVIAMIDKKLPILLVHSHQDEIIPINQSREIYLRFKESGHEHIYFLELEKGDHAGLIWGPQGDLFRDVVHAFYKRYNLPCNDEFASKINLDDYQPSILEIQERINRWNAGPVTKQDPAEEGFFSACLNLFL